MWCNRRVPWCPECDRYLAPPAVRADGTCPTCGRRVDAGGLHGPADERRGEREPLPPLPWHFKLLLAAFAVYLGFRFLALGEWFAGRF